jgi:hypothetical protein
MADLPPEVRTYVEGPLQSQLSKEEKEQLKSAEGKWPQFARALLALTDRHPTGLPGPASGPHRAEQLPEVVKRRLHPMKLKDAEKARLDTEKGEWPGYAIAVTEVIRARGQGMPEELGPAKLEDLPKATREFVENKLVPTLTTRQREHLKAAEGRWPDYPRAILELAQAQHKLPIPGMPHPPGPREFWDRLRSVEPR